MWGGPPGSQSRITAVSGFDPDTASARSRKRSARLSPPTANEPARRNPRRETGGRSEGVDRFIGGSLRIGPAGLSSTLRGHLVRRGFQLEELELGELFGKGGGGPRCLVNEMRGLVLNEGAPSYEALRERLHALMESYPEKVELPAAATPPAAAVAPIAASAAAVPPVAAPAAAPAPKPAN